MSKNGCYPVLYILSFLVISGCSSHELDINEQSDSYLTSFVSLTAEKDTILRGESSSITAKAIGNKISFLWSASEGPILGEGAKVLYVASPCCYGTITITCEAKANKESETKSILITVLK